jgi:hypothetical protein
MVEHVLQRRERGNVGRGRGGRGRGDLIGGESSPLVGIRWDRIDIGNNLTTAVKFCAHL